MDAATSKQNAYIKDLFLQCGVPDFVFNPVGTWKIKKREASELITSLRGLLKHYSGDLKDIICYDIQGKNIVKESTKTVDQLEEEKQATYDPTAEDWLDQQTYKDYILQKDWIQESQADILREQEAVA
jgi:hypothetical protein